jgi:transcriptional regulator with XRE-family HTH domain
VSSEAKLGPALLALRRRNNWTLKDVSERTGLAISTLSKAERNQLSLTYDKLRQLSEGLAVDITTFFDGPGASELSGSSGRRSISRRDDGRLVETANYNHAYLNTDLLKKKFIPIIADVRARSLEEFGPLVRHTGEEFAYVLEGSIEVHTEFYSPAVLREGDSIYFDSQMGHAYVAAGPGRCRILSINSAPEMTLMEAMGARRSSASGPAASAPSQPARARVTRARRRKTA